MNCSLDIRVHQACDTFSSRGGTVLKILTLLSMWPFSSPGTTPTSTLFTMFLFSVELLTIKRVHRNIEETNCCEMSFLALLKQNPERKKNAQRQYETNCCAT